MGYARGANVTITRSKIDVYQGTPRVLVRAFANQEDATVQFTGLEWRLTAIKHLLGAASYTASPTQPTFPQGITEAIKFGGTMDFTTVAVRFLHRTPTSGTVDVRLWKAQGMGELALNFGGDDLQEFNYQFRALPATTDHLQNALVDGENLIGIFFGKGVAT